MKAPIIGLIAFAYYVALSAKQWTWIFVSSDSGDWLTCTNRWFVPQAYGSPLYISLARLIGVFTDGNATVVVMTILLSCLPSAITVALIYIIVKRHTEKEMLAFVSAFVLLGCGVFLTQSTILEEYAIAIMFLTFAYWFYTSKRMKLTALALGLGTAIHIFILPITVFWFVLEYRRMRLKPIAVFTVSGILPYSLIPVLMHMNGNLSLSNLWMYWTGETGAVLGTLSIFDTPYRLLTLASILTMSFGLALIPLWFGLKQKQVVLLMIVLVSTWYYLTALDPAAWTFLNFGVPSLTILIGIGLSKLTLKHAYAVAVSALALTIVNGIFLNANVLTQERPVATTYYDELKSLPDGATIFATGAYSFGVLYVMSNEDKNFVLIATEEQMQEGEIYYAGPPNKEATLELLDIPGYTMIHKIEGIQQ